MQSWATSHFTTGGNDGVVAVVISSTVDCLSKTSLLRMVHCMIQSVLENRTGIGFKFVDTVLLILLVLYRNSSLC